MIAIQWLILPGCFDAQRSERRPVDAARNCLGGGRPVMEFWISWLGIVCRQLFSSTSSDVETAFPAFRVSCASQSVAQQIERWRFRLRGNGSTLRCAPSIWPRSACSRRFSQIFEKNSSRGRRTFADTQAACRSTSTSRGLVKICRNLKIVSLKPLFSRESIVNLNLLARLIVDAAEKNNWRG